MDFQKLFREVRNNGFPEIESKFISTEKFHFAHASAITGNIHYNPKNILALGFTQNAVKGVIAHELAHQVDFKRMGFFSRIWLTYKCSRNEVYRKGVERRADTITVKRGFGKDLIEAMRLTKKRFPKDRWRRYEAAHLSIKEMEALINTT
ncbi:MAG: hypothetical protein AABW71_01945 [Nanoarchaeota archaeon]